MLKRDIEVGRDYAVPCKKAGCQATSGEDTEDYRHRGYYMVHRVTVTANGRRGIEADIAPGMVRLGECTCPESGSWHVGSRSTTEPEPVVLRSTDIASPWEFAEIWQATRGSGGITFGNVDAEIAGMLGKEK